MQSMGGSLLGQNTELQTSPNAAVISCAWCPMTDVCERENITNVVKLL